MGEVAENGHAMVSYLPSGYWRAECDCHWSGISRWSPWRAERDVVQHLKVVHNIDSGGKGVDAK